MSVNESGPCGELFHQGLALAICQYPNPKLCQSLTRKGKDKGTITNYQGKGGRKRHECESESEHVPLPGTQWFKPLSFADWNSSLGLGSYYKGEQHPRRREKRSSSKPFDCPEI